MSAEEGQGGTGTRSLGQNPILGSPAHSLVLEFPVQLALKCAVQVEGRPPMRSLGAVP